MVVIIDYGMGNLKSVSNALNHIGIENRISDYEADIKSADALILPGVGAFPDAMNTIEKKGLDVIIKEEAARGKIILGICLGMQLLFEKSYETIEKNGLGLLCGSIEKMHNDKKNNIKIPHIGWNNLIFNKNNKILDGVNEGSFVYYVHSYCATGYDDNNLVSYSQYGENKIPSIVACDNIIGIQFHPEKSGECGLRILKNFGELIK